MIFTKRQLQEKCREQHKDLFVAFIDLSKVLDTMNRELLWSVLVKFGCPAKFVNILCQFHDGMTARVTIGGQESATIGCLQRILGLTWSDRVPHTEILAKTNYRSMEATITQHHLCWIGHVIRMPQDRLPRWDVQKQEMSHNQHPLCFSHASQYEEYWGASGYTLYMMCAYHSLYSCALLNYTSFEALVLALSHPTCKSQQPTLLVVMWGAPGPYTDFLSDFAEFLSSLVLKSASAIVEGDFNIHVDNESDSLSRAFLSLLESVGFSQCVHEPTHCFLHTLDLVLSYGVEINNLTVVPQNPLLSDHALITFDFLLLDDLPSAKSVYT
ncbi:uncharacterized protein V6R79_005228 [Siganus canaliculatus]